LLEVVLVAVFITLAVIAAGSQRRVVSAEAPGDTITLGDETDTDLPCPWCLAQTNEEDDACPTCGQLFG
jgi:hypothetical protein